MTVLITGATGQVGRNVVQRLAAGGERVRALTRRPDEANFPKDVEVVGGDLTLPASLESSLDGVTRMYLFPVPETATQVVAAARAAGVRRIVVLSSASIDYGDADDFGVTLHRPVERAAEDSGLEWIHVRGGEFMANTLAWWAPTVREERVVREVYGEVERAPVHEHDVADVAVAALQPDSPTGVTYSVHGPEPVTPVQQAKLIGEALGTDVRFDELTPEQAKENWIRNGMPEYVADELVELPGTPLDTMPAEVKRLIGHPGRTYREWVTDHINEFL